MRIACPHCHKKALIRSSNKLSDTVRDLYCYCSDIDDCGAHFVFSLAYKHDITPPQQTTLQLAVALIKHLPKEQLQALQTDFFG